MSPVVQSIIDLYTGEGISKAQFCRNIGVSKQTMENVLLGKNLPGMKIIYKILEHYAWVNPAWLITNEGNKKKSDGEIPEAVKLDLEEKTKIIEDLRALNKTQELAIQLLAENKN